MSIIRRVFDFKGAPILFAAFTVLLAIETRRRLRKPKASKKNRFVANSLVAIPSFGLLRLAFLPAMVLIARKNMQWKIGVAYWLELPWYIGVPVAFSIMDYTNYLWHILNHRSSFLWRFHLVHHTDPDLDVTTAIRFHFGELVGSVFFRGAFVLLSGASMLQVIYYEILFELATQFHHSNIRLPLQFEKKLNLLFVTPRMHGIHHSDVKQEADSNFSVIFSVWDRLHKTLQLNVPQHKVVIGVPGYDNADALNFKKLLQLPFTNLQKWPQLESHAIDANKNEMQA